MSENNTESRLSRTEAEIDALTKSFDSIAKSVEELSDSVHAGFRDIHNSFSDEVAKIYERVAKTQQTQWPTIFMGIAIILTLAGVFLAMYSVQRAEIIIAVDNLEDAQVKHAYADGYSTHRNESQDSRINILEWGMRRQ